MPGNRKNAPRLCDFNYLSSPAYFVTSLTYQRNPYFKDSTIVGIVLPILKYSSEKNRFNIYAYCFMPDHVHLLALGEDNSSLTSFIKTFKQRSSFAFRKAFGDALWHRSYYDHILRKDQAIKDVALYILNNPVRAGLTSDYKSYPFSGSFIFDIRELA